MGFAREWMMAKLGRADPGTYWGKVLGNRAEGVLTISPKQEGSGEPSPENVRPIHPGLTLVRDDDSVLEVYGGELDTTSGVLTVGRLLFSANSSTMNNSEDYPGWKNAGVRQYDPKNGTHRNGLTNVGKGYSINVNGNNDVIFLSPSLYGGRTQNDWIALTQDIQIVYELATPITYQLTETEVKRARRKIR